MSKLKIDLDNLGKKPEKPNTKKTVVKEETPPPKVTVSSESMGLVVTKKTTAKANTGGPKSQAEVYDQFMKLVYMFDISGSMSERILEEPTKPEHLSFDDYELMRLNRRVEFALDQAKLLEERRETMSDEEKSQFNEIEDSEEYAAFKKYKELLGDADIKSVSVDRARQLIFENKLWEGLGITPNPALSTPDDSKLQLVKTNCKKYIEDRLNKYPTADIVVIQFDDKAELLDCNSKELLMDSIDKMFPRGGTNIMQAIKYAKEICNKAPSPVNLHHFVLVSDGQDMGAMEMEEYKDVLIESGIVFDFIFLSSGYGNIKKVSTLLKEVCKSTGGDYVEVKTKKDFEKKFLAASTRLCLPPAPSV